MFGSNQKKRIAELEQRLKRQEQALKLKNEYISLQESYISKVIDQTKLTQQHLFNNRTLLENCFTESFVFTQAKEVVNSNFYWCKKSDDQTLLVVVDCGEGDAASIVVQTHVYHILEKCSTFQLNDLTEKLKEVLEYFNLEISLLLIDQNEVKYWGNSSIIFTQKQHAFTEQGTMNIQKVVDVDDIYLFSKGIVTQPNHDDENKVYSQKELLQFVQENQQLSKSKQFSLWEDELEEWMGCCGEQQRNMLFLGVKL